MANFDNRFGVQGDQDCQPGMLMTLDMLADGGGGVNNLATQDPIDAIADDTMPDIKDNSVGPFVAGILAVAGVTKNMRIDNDGAELLEA